MGKIKHLKEIEQFIENNKVFSVSDIKRFLVSKKANPDYAYLMVHNMAKKGKINRITKGYYTRYDDPMLIVYCIKPSYIGLESALSLHGLWEQETNVVLVTPRRIRFGVRKIFDQNVVVHPIGKEQFFGYDYIDHYDLKIPVSDIEKTFIDMVFYKHYLDKDVLKIFRRKLDKKKLKEYLGRYDMEFVDKVKGLVKI